VIDAPLERLNDHAWQVRLGDAVDAALSARVHALAAWLRAAAPPWLLDLVPAYASLGVFFDPERAPAEAVRRQLEDALASAPASPAPHAGREVEVPVRYGGAYGPDLEDAARELGLDAATLVSRHAAGTYTVAMIGFAPGFPYLLGLDPALALPRLATPRTRVPAGSVAIGGAQTGIYPRDSPGGWRLLGRTPLTLFDPQRDPPALLAPGDRMRFRPVDDAPPAPDEPAPPRAIQHHAARARVLAPGPLTTVQDLGRRGWRHLGVGLAGALDPDAAALANHLVGNPTEAALLECTLRGPSLAFDRPTRIALCGAQAELRFEDEDGIVTALPCGRPVTLPRGVLHVGALRGGARAWLAIAGGVAVPAVLGSRSTDLRGGFGGLHGRALQRDDELPLGEAACDDVALPRAPHWWIDFEDGVPADAPLRFVPTDPAAAALEPPTWRVDARSNRQGVRLDGAPLALEAAEQISAAVAPGLIQLPPDGRPIVLLADAQTTGGYPRLGYVIAADLPRLARLRPGTPLRLAAVDEATAQAAWQERRARLARLMLAIDARVAAR